MLTDSHCHLHLLENEGLVVEDILQKAGATGVKRFLSVAINIKSWERLLDLAKNHPQIFISLGLHPCTDPIESQTDVYLDTMREILKTHKIATKIIAIGEIGLDYYHFDKDATDLAWQKKRFIAQTELAIEFNKPIIIHTRESTPDVINILTRYKNQNSAAGVMHCFVDNYDLAKQCLDLGFYISFSGIATFKNAQDIRDVAKKIPLDRLLVETDSPYLAPPPYRGKTNQPAYVIEVAKCLADIHNLPLDTFLQQTENNFDSLFFSNK